MAVHDYAYVGRKSRWPMAVGSALRRRAGTARRGERVDTGTARHARPAIQRSAGARSELEAVDRKEGARSDVQTLKWTTRKSQPKSNGHETTQITR